MNLTKEQLRAMIPDAKEKNIDKFLLPLNAAMEKFQINTPLRVAAFIAQITHESGSLHYVEEIADGRAYEYRKDLGNLEEAALQAAHAKGTTTGRFYKGYGLIQITGFYNHRACGLALGYDGINTPSRLKEPTLAAASAAWFFNTHNCNSFADVGLFGTITKLINGGFNGANERMKNYARCKKVLGV